MQKLTKRKTIIEKSKYKSREKLQLKHKEVIERKFIE